MIAKIDEKSARKISAGQVITDLASVVKELLENALDAGAHLVAIRLYNYGLDKIVVDDNGTGIPMFDIFDSSSKNTIACNATTPLLSSRATTKRPGNVGDDSAVDLTTLSSDLEQLDSLSLGFRGEALYSLAHLSQVTVETMHESYHPHTVRIAYNSETHSTQLTLEKTRQTLGTTVTAANLFHHLPVRRKEYCKNCRKQLLRTTLVVKQYAVSHPQLRLVMTHQETAHSAAATLVALTGSNDLLRSVTEAYGGLCLSRMCHVQWACSFGELVGFVSKVGGGGRLSTDHQVFALDRRLVDLPRVANAINDAFSQCLPNAAQRLSVAFFLQITMKECGWYDVNVVPSKRKVLMSNEDKIVDEVHRMALNEFQNASEGIELSRETRIANIHASNVRAAMLTKQVLTPISSTSFTEFVFKKEDLGTGTPITPSLDTCSQFDKLQSFLYGDDAAGKPTSQVTGSNADCTDSLFSSDTDEEAGGERSAGTDVIDAPPAVSEEAGDESMRDNRAVKSVGPNPAESVDEPAALLYKRQRREATEVAHLEALEKCIVYSDESNKSREKGAITAPVVFPSWERLAKERLPRSKREALSAGACSHSTECEISHDAFSRFEEQTEKELDTYFHKRSFKEMRVLGQFNHGFILTALGNDLFVIDQHASDEKYNYERLLKGYVAKLQPLVMPVPVAMDAEEVELALTHSEDLRQHGFQVKRGDDPTKLLVCSIPVLPYDVVNVVDILELIQQLVRYHSIHQSLHAVWHSLATKACRGSIMIGTALTPTAMRTIVNRLGELDQPWTCPHGRPTLRHLSNIQNLKAAMPKP